MVNLERLDNLLKTLVFILLLVLLITIRVYKLDSCDLIRDKTEGLSQANIVNNYFDTCLKDYRIKLDNPLLSKSINFSIKNLD
jgi:hypothetical protein